MKEKFNKNLIKGSFILIVAFGLFNFLHFLFQFFMVRMLSISDYGILASLFAIIYITTVIVESVQTIITKYSTNEENKGRLKNLFNKSVKKAFRISFIIYMVYLAAAIPLSYLLKIPYFLVSLTGLVIFFAFLTPVPRGIMQGRKRFSSLSFSMLAESVGKLVLGVGLVIAGFRVYGAIIGAVLGGFVALIFSFVQLKDILKSKEEKSHSEGIYNYAKPTFFITASIIVFYSLDVIIAKILFPPETAGVYAVASILGKIIFWGTLPVSKAMFPISAEKNTGIKRPTGVFGNSIALILIGIVLVLCAFYFAPGYIIKIFRGEFINEAASILFFVGIAFGFISVANLLLLYKLSIGKTKNYPILALFVLLEIFLLVYFSKDLMQFSVAFITSSIALLWGSVFLMNE